MSNNGREQNGEVDLIDAIIIIWDRKWYILFIALFCLFIGFGYTELKFKQDSGYKILSRFANHIYSVDTQITCLNTIKCMNILENKRVVRKLVDRGWIMSDKDNFYKILKQPPKISDLIVELDEIEKALTDEMLLEAEAEMSMIKNELDKAFMTTESAADNFLKSKRVIKYISYGKPVVSFSLPTILAPDPNEGRVRVLIISLLFGGIIGICWAFINYSMKMRRENPSSK